MWRILCVSSYGLFLLLLPITANSQDKTAQKFSNISGPEKLWVLTHPFIAKKALRVSENARVVSKEMEKDKQLDGYDNGGQVDAFRHVYWMATLCHVIKWNKAEKLGKAHEKGNEKDFKKNREEEGEVPDATSVQMDLWNNHVGIIIGRRSKENHQTNLKGMAKSAVLKGQCRIIRRNEKGDFLDVQGNIIAYSEWHGVWNSPRCLVTSNQVN